MGSEDQVRAVTIQLGKNKHSSLETSKLSKKQIINSYKDETQSIITRPASAVAKFDIENWKLYQNKKKTPWFVKVDVLRDIKI